MLGRVLGWAAVVGVGAGLVSSGGCSPKVTTEAAPLASRAHNPTVVYVTDFYLDPSAVKSEHAVPRPLGGGGGPLRGAIDQLRGEDPQTKAANYVRLLSQTITDSLNSAGVRAEYRPGRQTLRSEMVPPDADFPSSGWIVGGWFDRVNQENRAIESTVGFGTGGGDVEIQVVVSDAAKDPREPFLVLGSESAAKIMPGGLVTRNPYAMAAKFVLSKNDAEMDIRKQGRAIADHLVKYINTGKP